jgi:tetratricopeptide (TPR) repeat protein
MTTAPSLTLPRCAEEGIVLVVLAVLLAIAPVAAAPFVPADDAQVLERLPEKLDPSLVELKRLRSALAQHPDDLSLATKFARRAIEAAREAGDPRYLGQAQAALAPWWSLADPPPAALLLRATLKQSTHDFAGALADLDRLIAQRPTDGQALLTRATVLTVQGRYGDARADCARIARLTIPLVTSACAAAPASLSGEAESASYSLALALARQPDADASLREWALTLAAEIAWRRGDHGAAETQFRAALALDARDPYLIAAYADFLLDRGRAAEVVPLVRDYTRNDSLLLRLALAEARLPQTRAAFETHRADLAARFDAARRRGDSLHRREEALYTLAILGDARAALKLARENWQVQKEPADLRILVAAALAARDAQALDEARAWIASHKLEDASIAALLKVKA